MSDKEHARFSPSSTHRRIACPGSLALEEQVPATTSDYAEEGTAAHELMEWAFRDNATFLDNYEGKKTKNGWKINKQMIAAVQTFVNTIRAKAANYERLGAKVQVLCESRVTYADEMIPVDIKDEDGIVMYKKSGGFFGTADIIIIATFKNGDVHISVDDLKYGMGVKVDAEENEQLLSYGLAVVSALCLAYNIVRVCMAIHQPRLYHVDEWEVPLSEIYTFRDALRPAAQRALKLADDLNAGHTSAKRLDKGGQLVPGDDQCQFCRAKAHCPALARWAAKQVDDMFENLDDPIDVKGRINEVQKGLLTLDQIENFGLKLDLFEEFIKAVRGRIQAELFKGEKLKHWKLVQGRKGNSAWADEAEAERVLKSMRLSEADRYKRELISPTRAKEIFAGKTRRLNTLQKIIVQADGKPSIAPMKDKRPAIQPPDVNDMFDDLSDSFDDLA